MQVKTRISSLNKYIFEQGYLYNAFGIFIFKKNLEKSKD